MANFNRFYHKFKSIVGYSIAAIVIVIALAISGFRLILTTANLYQSEVEQLASSILKQPVRIGSMDAKLSNLAPTLIFNNVQLVSKKSNKNLFSLSRVDVGLSFTDLVFYQKITPEQIIIRGMDLYVTRTVQGTYKIKGFDLDGLDSLDKKESSSLLENWLLQQGHVAFEDSTLFWVDEQNAGLTWYFDDINLLLKKEHERYRLSLFSKLPGNVGGEIKISLDLKGDITSQKSWDIKAYIESNGLNLTAIKQYLKNSKFELIGGETDVRLWADWRNNKLEQLSGDVKLRDFSYSRNNKKVNLKLVSGMFDAISKENGAWNISVDRLSYLSGSVSLNDERFSLAFDYKDKVIRTFYVKANNLKLKPVSKIVTDNHLVSIATEKNINKLNPGGEIDDLYVAWKNNEINDFRAKFTDLSTSAWNNFPKVKSLSGNITYADKKGLISLLSDNSVVGFPKIFRDDFTFERLSSDIDFINTNKGVLFNFKYLKTDNVDLKAISSAKFWFPKNNSSPYLDFQTYVSNGDASKVSKYLPVGIMDDALVKWLDRGIVSGKLNSANVIFSGKLNEFPFNKNEGIFTANLEAEKVSIDYWDDWPKIENAKVSGEITDQGLSFHLSEGISMKNTLFNSVAKINSFSVPILALEINSVGTTHNTMQYLVNSPILSKAKDTINASRLLGQTDMNINITIPLTKKAKTKMPLSYSGTAVLNNSSLFMLDDKLDIKNASGKILFNEKKISSEKLSADIFNEKIKLSILSSKNEISVTGKGKMSPGPILQIFNIPGAKNISGRTRFSGRMNFPIKSSETSSPTLIINSELSGIKSEYPESLQKDKKKKQNATFITRFVGNNKTQFELYFREKGSAVLEILTSKGYTYLNKGAISISKNKAVFPNRKILFVDGSIDAITPAVWSDLLASGSSSKNNFIVHPIVLNLDSLKILTREETATNKISSIITPNDMPVIEGKINNLYFNKMFLGKLDLKTSKSENSFNFDEILLSTKTMNLFSHGNWSYIRRQHKTNLDITLKSENVGEVLNNLGYSSIIDKGTANTISKLNWLGAPSQFSLKKLNGKIKLNIENGNIKNIDAGAGRLLGFVSLSALPRKLLGDFKDTFKSGYSFDVAKGSIELKKGNAYTNNFKVDSSVSKIRISGRTGLVDRDYNNRIKVIPDVGGGLAGIAALLVNLPAGVGFWLFDKLTGEKIDEASSKMYQVSGNWDKPKIELIEK